jgi:hypothetical protein
MDPRQERCLQHHAESDVAQQAPELAALEHEGAAPPIPARDGLQGAHDGVDVGSPVIGDDHPTG